MFRKHFMFTMHFDWHFCQNNAILFWKVMVKPMPPKLRRFCFNQGIFNTLFSEEKLSELCTKSSFSFENQYISQWCELWFNFKFIIIFDDKTFLRSSFHIFSSLFTNQKHPLKLNWILNLKYQYLFRHLLNIFTCYQIAQLFFDKYYTTR